MKLRIAVALVISLLLVGAICGRASAQSNPLVGIAYDPAAAGYWTVTDNGNVAAHGAAPFLGDVSSLRLAAPVDGIVATKDGRGYWLFAKDGGVFAFGDAHYYGSMSGVRLAGPVTAMSPTTDGHGYWLLGSDGGVFAFGDAPFYGSLNPVSVPTISIRNNGATAGYTIVSSNGLLVDLMYHKGGGQAPLVPAKTIIASVTVPDSKAGYWMLTNTGQVIPFIGASTFGDMSQYPNHQPVVGMSTTPDGLGYVIATTSGVYAFGDAF